MKAALSAMVVKTDRKDARGIAQLLRMGWFRPVHAKSPAAQEIRALLVARKLLQAKLLDVELSIRGILRGFGLKMGEVSKARLCAACWELVAGQAMLERIIEPMLRAREALRIEYAQLHRDAEHRQARCCVSAADDSTRRGRAGGDHVQISRGRPWTVRQVESRGRTFRANPRKYQSGQTDVTGGISRVGDAMVRAVLYEAAHIMLSRATRFSSLKRWAMDVAKRRGLKRAKVALARKLATVLHRMWLDGADPLGQGGQRRRVTREEVFGAAPEGCRSAGSRRRDGGSGEAVNPGVAADKAGPRVPRLARRLPSDGMMATHMSTTDGSTILAAK